jgi:hypothetical protein
MATEESDQNASVERIKKELDSLLAQQSNALSLAVYVGMSRDEVNEYDARLEKIKKLVAQLAKLQTE